ncbi:unnamed protein product [Linum trigynum]|uniref:Reverse transcriptase domain-containing protein n=1 Tax=Linum trigynum TaxID=586398 RepID=A0AAV2GNJ6_9ROSI
MRGLKAPGVDGYPTLFYQNRWKQIGDSLVRLVSDCFHRPHRITDFNDTVLVLIPKKESTEMIAQFRPIGLCNVIYKSLAKCLANRIKPMMQQLVHKTQTSFVPGRHITDNIIILQEVLHSMRQKKGKCGHMVIKVDLAKAYDRLSWTFLRETLE